MPKDIINAALGMGDPEENYKKSRELTEKLAKYEASLREKLGKEANEKSRKQLEKNLKDYYKVKKDLDKADAAEELSDRIENEQEIVLKAKQERLKAEADLHKKQLINATALGKVLSANGKSMAENMLNAASKAASALTSGAEKAMGTYAKYYSGLASRLQGSGLAARDIFSTVSRAGAANPYVTITDVLDKISTLVERGVADNVTQRAFLASVADKIAPTFDAMSSSLLQLTRIVGKDTQNNLTAARLGLESNLTKLFNYYFSDTSYLSQQFDNVQGILMDVSAQLGAQAGVEFEYQAQKWLGSLGSLGVSDTTLSTIAQGLNYLGTGNISQLSGNQALQNLLVMSMNKGGNLSYTDLLTKGISSAQANQLLYNIVQYIRDIATIDNNVVRAQYADIFGISMTDMVALSKVQQSTLDEIYKQAMTYRDTLKEVNTQLSTIGDRMHLSTMIDNVMENVMTATGMNIANNTALYATYKAADILESITGGIMLPTIGVLGSFVSPNMSIERIIKSGIIGIGAIGSLIGAVGNIFSGGFTNLDSWTTQSNKGQGFGGTASLGELRGTRSSTVYVSSTSGAGVQQSILDQQTAEGEVITGEKEDSQEVLIEAIKYLRDYFQRGGDIGNPLRVQVEGYGLFKGGNE